MLQTRPHVSSLPHCSSCPLLSHSGWCAPAQRALSFRPRILHTSRANKGLRARRMAPQAPSAAAHPDSKDLLIVGPGVLGSHLGKLWLDKFPGATVVGQTNTHTNHDRLRSLGLQPRTKADASSERYPYILFAAPPSGSEDYVGEVKSALKLWDGSGCFVYTGSAGIYSAEDGSEVREESPTSPLGKDDRTDRLISVEQAVLEGQGCVVRLAGLYHAQRGAHTFFLRMGKVPRWGGYTVNLIHYEDAARLAAAVLQGDGAQQPYRGRVFLGADGAPIIFEDMMDATVASGAYSGAVEFTGQEDVKKGKILNNAMTKEALNWQPKYKSYKDFMAAGARDWYTDNPVEGAPHKD